MTLKRMGKSYLEVPARITVPKPPKNYVKHSTRSSPKGLGNVVQVRDKRIARCES